MKSIIRIALVMLMASQFSCKPQITLRSATWYTWTGGQAGVGGARYQFTLDNRKQTPFSLQEVIIEGKSIDENEVTMSGDSIQITTSERISRATPTVNNPNPKQERLRSEAPESAIILGMVKNKKVKIEVDSFRKTTAVRIQ